jgi:hypothetical protein
MYNDYSETFKPEDCYFHAKEGENGIEVTICDKEFFNEKGYLNIEASLETDWMVSILDAVYEPIDTSLTIDEVTERLLAEGFEEDSDFSDFMMQCYSLERDNMSCSLYIRP